MLWRGEKSCAGRNQNRPTRLVTILTQISTSYTITGGKREERHGEPGRRWNNIKMDLRENEGEVVEWFRMSSG
jgi:hypothetical protein